jgi:thymidylate synthase ThyX
MSESQIKVKLNPDVKPAGSDLSIVNAARRSFNTRSEWDMIVGGEVVDGPHSEKLQLKPKDKRLLEFLARGMTADDFYTLKEWFYEQGDPDFSEELVEKLWQWRNTPTHDTPFNHTFISFEVQAPIFVRAQLVKHEYLILSEFSRRYITDNVEFYEPDVWRTKPEGNIKQGSGTSSLPKPDIRVGFCRSCGVEIKQPVRTQGGGRVKTYCSGTCKNKCNNEHRNPYKTVFSNAEARVKREGKREWSLDFDTFKFPEYCVYLGIKLDYSYGKGEIKPNSPSFDRIDPSKDYVEGNVQLISNRANSMKNDADVEAQVKMAKQVLLMHEGYSVQEDRTYVGHCNKQLGLYSSMVDAGYSAEQARMVLPQNVLTEWTWSGTLGAFAKMCTLRLHPEAQYEARLVAQQVYEYLKEYWPVGAKALVEGPDV